MDIKIFKTNRRQRFAKGEPIAGDAPIDTVIHLGKGKQRILGYGGAFTDASASIYANLPLEAKREFVRLTFSSQGLNYNLGRVTIASCDFSIAPYDYASKDDLSDFSIDHDRKQIIPMILDAMEAGTISLLASCWSPLGKWKSNKRKEGGGKLLEDHYGRHGEYIARFVEEYRKEGIDISMITVQNEPAAEQIWESCLFSPLEEARMAILLHERLPDTKIYILDHNRDILNERVEAALHVPMAKEAVYGVAYHWYDKDKNIEIAKLRQNHPELSILFSEGCVELLNLNPANPAEAIGAFENGVTYARNYILDLNYGSEGFLDWNLLLDLHGGPNHAKNYCEAPILSDGLSLYPTYSYYFIKHISAFLRKGARVLENDNDGDLLFAAALNEDNSIGLVVYNPGQDNRAIRVYISEGEFLDLGVDGNEIASCEIRI